MWNKINLSAKIKGFILAILAGIFAALFLCLLITNLQLRKAIDELSNKKDSEYAYKLKQEKEALKAIFDSKNLLKKNSF